MRLHEVQQALEALGILDEIREIKTRKITTDFGPSGTVPTQRFTQLIDTPSGYKDQAGKLLQVNAVENEVIFSNEMIIDIDMGGNSIHNIQELTFDPTPSVVSEVEGAVYWNGDEHTLNLVTGLGPVLQVGQELYTLVYNATGSQIANGTAVYPVGAVGGVPSVAEANATTHVTFAGIVLITTMDIPNNTTGIAATKLGKVRGLDTSGFSAGDTIWLASDNNPGILNNLTNVEPSFPDYKIQIGGINISDETGGVVELAIEGKAIDTVQNFWNGTFRETINFTVSSSGGVITGSLTPENGHDDMTMMFSDGLSILDTSPAATVTLTAGTDATPVQNFVYVPRSTKVLTVATDSWPTEEHIKVANIFLRSAAKTEADGALVNRNWNDHIENTNTFQGHLAHIGEKLRQFEAQWDSGAEGTITINTNAGTPDNLYVTVTAGLVYQLHLQTFPTQEMPTDDIHVVNHPTTPYLTVNDLGGQILDSEGGTLTNKWFSFVIWGVINRTGQKSHIMCNLPSGSYNSEASAVSDALGYTNYTIPKAFQGTGFLIGRYTLNYSPASGGTWSFNLDPGYQDLRGFIPNATAGSGAGSSGITTFLGLADTPVSYAGNAGRMASVNSGESALNFDERFMLNSQDGNTTLVIRDSATSNAWSSLYLTDADETFGSLGYSGYLELAYDIDDVFGYGARTTYLYTDGPEIRIMNGSVTDGMRICVGDDGKTLVGKSIDGYTIDRQFQVFNGINTNNVVTPMMRLTVGSSGTSQANFGTGIEFEIQGADNSYLVAGGIDVLLTDPATGAEDSDMVFNVSTGGAVASEKMKLSSAGKLTIDSFIEIHSLGTSNFFIGNTNFRNLSGADNNVVMGLQAGWNGSSADRNVIFGNFAAFQLTTGSRNVFAGYQAGSNVSGGSDNVAIGYQAYTSSASSFSSGIDNTSVGCAAGEKITSGSSNSLYGRGAGGAITSGIRNTMIGYQTGLTSNNGSRNVFIGYRAGRTSSASDVLMIETNDDSTTPLVYGEFNNDLFRINGHHEIIGNADIVQHLVRAHSTQTSNILEIQDAGSNVLTSVNNSGDLHSAGEISVPSDTKVVLNGAGGNTYIIYNSTSGNVEIYKGGVLQVSW
jgi:hypothetical protein